MWSIVFNQSGNKTILDKDNPKFYLCERYFADKDYQKFSKLPIAEVVSVDSMLFPITERTLLDEQTAIKQEIKDGLQILRVYCVIDEDYLFAERIDDFAFCGYDLAEEFEISALTNCGGFDETFSHTDLNSFGLIPDFASAKKIQIDLAVNNPDEEHADCLLFAIWRRI